MYDETIKRIEGQESDDVQLAKRILMWISCAIRPLTALELRHALAIEPDTTELDEEALPDEEIVISVCAGLVTIDQETNTIRLVHYTTQEYLQRRRDEYFPTAQKDISRTCLTYLSLNVFFSDDYPDDDEQDLFLRETVFLGYASRNWSIHAAGEPEKDPNIQQLALKFLEHPSVALGIVQNQAISRWNPKRFIPELVCLAALGLTSIVEVFVAQGCRIDVVDEYQRTALHYAAQNGHECTLRFLLRNRPQLVHYKDRFKVTTLHLSASNGHEAVSRTLCEYEAVADAKDSEGETPLHLATRKAHVGIARVLLEYGADVDAQSDNGNAAQRQDSPVLPLLFEYGAKVDLRMNDGETTLMYAARSGREDNSQILLDAGADVNKKADSGATALHIATLYGHIGMVRLLLDAGADIETVSEAYFTWSAGTALQWAEQAGNSDIMQILKEAQTRKSTAITQADI
jgi:ankyrin repeat protein